MIVRVTTGSRLHFGLFSLPGQASDRQFGGVGLMVEQPGLVVRAMPADGWSAAGPCQERARLVAEKAAQALGLAGPFAVGVDSCPPEHVGLGTGTQLSLAIAHAIQQFKPRDEVLRTLGVVDMARNLGRGERSALGIHGFLHGGFLVEGGKGPATQVSPLIARADFPDSWRVLVMLPAGKPGRHGQPEREAFADLARREADNPCDALCRLTLLGMLPALLEADLESFGHALHEFNHRVGEMFRPAQGGIYSHPATASLVHFLRQHGVHGVGQSSWGPTTFAVTEMDRAEHLAALVRQRFALTENEVIITSARNRGAVIGKV